MAAVISRRGFLIGAVLVAMPIRPPKKKRRLVPADSLTPSESLYPRG